MDEQTSERMGDRLRPHRAPAKWRVSVKPVTLRRYCHLPSDAVEIGAQRVGGEVLLPEARRELGDFGGGVAGDALEDVHQVVIGIDAVQR